MAMSTIARHGIRFAGADGLETIPGDVLLREPQPADREAGSRPEEKRLAASTDQAAFPLFIVNVALDQPP